MPNIYETLIGAPPSGPEQTRETANQLRGQEQLGMLGILTGDRVLTSFGKSMVSQVQNRVKGLQQSRQKAVEDQIQADRWDTTDTTQEGVREQAQKNWDERMQFDRDKMEQGNALKLALQEMKTVATRKETDKAVTSMSKELVKANVPQLEVAFEELTAELAPYINEDGSIKGNIPGAGATGLLPAGILSSEGKKVRQTIANVRNQVMKMMSGAAVTDPEAARLYEQIGQYLGGSDEDIVRGLQGLQNMSERNKDYIQSGYSDAVIAEWDRRRAGRGAAVAETQTVVMGDAMSYLKEAE